MVEPDRGCLWGGTLVIIGAISGAITLLALLVLTHLLVRMWEWLGW